MRQTSDTRPRRPRAVAAGDPPDDRPVLVVLHQERSTAGRTGPLLAARGFRLDIRRPPLGDPLPDTLDRHAGAIVFGGPMSANDPDPFVRREIDWLAVPLAENRPYLGICLGAQLLVKQLGGTVAGREDGRVEIGWYPIAPTQEGEALLPDWPRHVYHFHREGCDLPSGSLRLAEGEVYPNQAFRHGENAWGLQFHPELTLAMMHRWAVKGARWFDLPDAQPGRAHIAGRFVHDPPFVDWFDRFLGLVFTGDPAPARAQAMAARPGFASARGRRS